MARRVGSAGTCASSHLADSAPSEYPGEIHLVVGFRRVRKVEDESQSQHLYKLRTLAATLGAHSPTETVMFCVPLSSVPIESWIKYFPDVAACTM